MANSLLQDFSVKATSAEAMMAIGAQLAECCQGGEIITLQGNLGAGKTTLVRGFLRQLGHSGTVKSPTYTLVETYDYRLLVHHFDLYRLQDEEELEMMGFRDYLSAQGVCLIEWPECYPALLQEADARISIDYVEEGRHVILQAQI